MIKGVKFHVLYANTGNADAFLSHLPGYPSYICCHERFKGDTGAVLDLIVYLIEVEKVCFLPQDQTVESVIMTGEGGRVCMRVGGKGVLPVRRTLQPAPAPALTDFCPN